MTASQLAAFLANLRENPEIKQYLKTHSDGEKFECRIIPRLGYYAMQKFSNSGHSEVIYFIIDTTLDGNVNKNPYLDTIILPRDIGKCWTCFNENLCCTYGFNKYIGQTFGINHKKYLAILRVQPIIALTQVRVTFDLPHHNVDFGSVLWPIGLYFQKESSYEYISMTLVEIKSNISSMGRLWFLDYLFVEIPQDCDPSDVNVELRMCLSGVKLTFESNMMKGIMVSRNSTSSIWALSINKSAIDEPEDVACYLRDCVGHFSKEDANVIENVPALLKPASNLSASASDMRLRFFMWALHCAISI